MVWLTAIWLLLQGSITWGNVLAGLVLAALVLVVFPLPRLIMGLRVRPWALAVLVVRFQLDLIVSSCRVAWQAVRPGPVVDGIVMDVWLRGRKELFQTITAEMVALVPGTVVIDLVSETGRLTLHALDVHTPAEVEGVRKDVLELEQRVLRALAAPSEEHGVAAPEGGTA
jgi:multicomponent Na+:H+ antiporter subunit E